MCVHCQSGAPLKAPAGTESYHMVEVEGGVTYARCTGSMSSESEAERPSAESEDAAARVNQALAVPCVHGLTDHRGRPTYKWDCSGCTRDVVARALEDAVRQERGRCEKALTDWCGKIVSLAPPSPAPAASPEPPKPPNGCMDCRVYGCPNDGPDPINNRAYRHCDCHGPYRKVPAHDPAPVATQGTKPLTDEELDDIEREYGGTKTLAMRLLAEVRRLRAAPSSETPGSRE